MRVLSGDGFHSAVVCRGEVTLKTCDFRATKETNEIVSDDFHSRIDVDVDCI